MRYLQLQVKKYVAYKELGSQISYSKADRDQAFVG